MNIFTKTAMIGLAIASFAIAKDGISFGGHVSAAYSAFWDQAKEIEDYGFWGPGFNAGIGVYIPFTAQIGLNPEVSFAYRYESGSNEGYDVSLSQTNIDIPVLLRVNVYQSLFVEGGPFLSLNLSDDWDVDAPSSEEYNYDDYYDEYDDYSDEDSDDLSKKALEFGLLFGVGYSITPSIDVDARFGLGLTNLYKDFDAKSFMFHIGGTYWFM